MAKNTQLQNGLQKAPHRICFASYNEAADTRNSIQETREFDVGPGTYPLGEGKLIHLRVCAA